MKNMNRMIGAGVLWNLAALFLTRGATTLFMLFLARLLAPAAFGLIAMATVVFELANVFVTSGLGQALIRSKSISNTDLNTVFFTNLLLSSLAYTIIYLGAPYVAEFYSQPELTNLIQVMGLVVFINATRVVQVSVLTREMDFKSQMKATTIGALGSGILAILAAYNDSGVWSLVLMVLSQALITSMILWIASSWRPKAEFSSKSFLRLFRFGRNLLAEGILEVLFQNSFVLIIGRYFSAEITGLYFFAKKISNLISQQLTSAVQAATFPALSTIQDENKLLRKKYRQIIQLMMFLIAPIMGMLAGLASPLFSLFLNDKWQGAVIYLQLLCFVGALYPIHALNINLLNVKGRSDLVLKLGLLKKSINLALLFAAIPYGVIGIVISQIIGSVLALIPNSYFCARILDYTVKNQVSDYLKPLVSALGAGIIVWWFGEKYNGMSFDFLLLLLILGGVIYLVGSALLKSEGLVFSVHKIKEQIITRRN